MENEPYSYHYLYQVSHNNMDFIKKMITIFTGSLDEYITELENLQQARNLDGVKHLVHRFKPSIMNLEMQDAKHEMELLSDQEDWSPQVQHSIDRLIALFREVRPLMERDLEEMV